MLHRWRRLTQALDRAQRRHRVSSVAVAVLKRYSDDKGGQLAALITYYGFLSVFPLLLLLITAGGLLLHGSRFESSLINSALSQFPVIGAKLKQNIHAVAHGNIAATVVSLLGLTWGSLGITNTLQNAVHKVWHEPLDDGSLGLGPRTLKGVQVLGALLAIVVLSTAAAGASTVGSQFFGGHSFLLRAVAFLAALIVNFAGYLLVMWLLSPTACTWAQLRPGAVVGSVGWTILQALSGYLLGHQLHHASQIYGFFAVVLGLTFWISLGAQLFLYANELNVILLRHEWPRYFFGEPSPEAASSTT